MSSYFIIFRNFIKANSTIKKTFIKKLLNKVNLDRAFEANTKKYYYMSTTLPTPKSLINIKTIGTGYFDKNIIDYTCKMYLSHRFNILGSGWVSANYNFKSLGIEGIQYNKCSNRVFSNNVKTKVDDNYQLIDWNRDIKSGFLFNENELSTKVTHNLPRGVDLKMPWELSRMYHLPQMALAANLLPAKRELLILEFKNQVIDFCESNPIGYGVNWSCTMEVAIRAVNLLVAYDIFVQIDNANILNQSFRDYFSSKIMQHGKFIFKNLEINFITQKNGNHYLSNLCGLLFIGSYLKNNETKKWFDFSAKEFIKEFDNQFLNDGGNYECSTAYHRLSAEISAYCFALLIRNGISIDHRILEKINSVAEFATLIIRPDGKIIQIGDNDSGRLLKLNLSGKFITSREYEEQFYNGAGYSNLYGNEDVFVENELSVYPVIAIIYAITNYGALKRLSEKAPIEYGFIKSILNNNTVFCNYAYDYRNIDRFKSTSDVVLPELSHKIETQIILPIEGFNLADANVEVAPYFGLVTFTINNIKIFVRSVSELGLMQNAHIHNDFLHYEISIDKENFFCDQGSYIYTPLCDKRDEFRSVKAHNTPYYGMETNKFIDCFYTDINIRGFINEITNNTIGMVVYFNDIVHFRKIELNNNVITVKDNSNKPFKYECKEFEYLSLGYGTMLKSKNNDSKIIIQSISKQ